MAEESFPFQELAEGDRTVSAAMFAKHLGFIRTRGVIQGVDNQLAVSESSPQAMSVDIDTGGAFVGLTEQRAYRNTLARTLTIAAADPTDPRHDIAVLTMDTASGVRSVTAEIVQGTPAPSPVDPALTQTEAKYQLSIARVLVPAGATSIANADITDLRTFSEPNNNPAAPKVPIGVTQSAYQSSNANYGGHDGTFEFDANGPTLDSQRLWYVLRNGVSQGRLTRLERLGNVFFNPRGTANFRITADWTNLQNDAVCIQMLTISATDYLFVIGLDSGASPFTVVGKRYDADDLSVAPTSLTMTGFNTHTASTMRSYWDGTNLWVIANGTTRTVYRCSVTATAVTVQQSFTPVDAVNTVFSDGTKVFLHITDGAGSRRWTRYTFAGTLEASAGSSGPDVQPAVECVGRYGNQLCWMNDSPLAITLQELRNFESIGLTL